MCAEDGDEEDSDSDDEEMPEGMTQAQLKKMFAQAMGGGGGEDSEDSDDDGPPSCSAKCPPNCAKKSGKKSGARPPKKCSLRRVVSPVESVAVPHRVRATWSEEARTQR